MTRDDVIAKLKKMTSTRGSKSGLAVDLGISPQFLGDVLAGRREPGTKLLSAMGLEKVIFYSKIKAK
jgi:hypothetical protein